MDNLKSLRQIITRPEDAQKVLFPFLVQVIYAQLVRNVSYFNLLEIHTIALYSILVVFRDCHASLLYLLSACFLQREYLERFMISYAAATESAT